MFDVYYLQILLRNRSTNLNARMHDGTTPLILACRLAMEGMVEDLINADADINATDNNGRKIVNFDCISIFIVCKCIELINLLINLSMVFYFFIP